MFKTPRSLRPQSRLLNSIERQLVILAVHFHYNRVARRRLQYPDKPAPAISRQLQLGNDPLTDESLEMRARAQDPIEARRRNLQRVVPLDRILDLENLAHRVTDACAVSRGDAGL